MVEEFVEVGPQSDEVRVGGVGPAVDSRLQIGDKDGLASELMGEMLSLGDDVTVYLDIWRGWGLRVELETCVLGREM